MFGSRQVFVGICHSQTQADQRKMHSLRQRCRSELPPETVLGTVLHKKLCSQLRTTVELQVIYICQEACVTTDQDY
jgi:hypothetical protein